MKAISLFASGGIGDLAFKACGVDIILSNELLHDRCQVLSHNYPESKIIEGDIWEKKQEIIDETRKLLKNETLNILYATPPCQGMSKNGRGTLLNNIRKGVRPKFDERNRLIIPTIDIAIALNPEIIILENVSEMKDTFIEDENSNAINIIDFIKTSLGERYVGKAEVVEFADYGVPQRRKRLITIFSRNEVLISFFKKFDSFLPETTHNIYGDKGKKRWVSVKDAIGNLPPLDAKNKLTATSKIPFHRVPILDDDKYFWVSNTKPEKGAFDNQCISCGFEENPTHGSEVNKKGINKAKTSTPIRCIKCNELLPRPWVNNNGNYQLMKGFTSAYRRMSWNKPSNALTTNLSYACSDSKLHPEQNRVLSLYEAFIIHTVADFKYEWIRVDGKNISDKTIREIIGESIPPRGLKLLIQYIVEIYNEKEPQKKPKYKQLLMLE